MSKPKFKISVRVTKSCKFRATVEDLETGEMSAVTIGQIAWFEGKLIEHQPAILEKANNQLLHLTRELKCLPS